MKATGIVRLTDKLGRIVLPIELRKTLDIAISDSLEIFVESDLIILRKTTNTCYICANKNALKDFRMKKICMNCINEISK